MKKGLKKIAGITLFSFTFAFIFTPVYADSTSRRIVNEHTDRTDRNIDLFGETGTPAIIRSASNGFVKVAAGVVLLITGIALVKYFTQPQPQVQQYQNDDPPPRRHRNSRYYNDEDNEDDYTPPPPKRHRNRKKTYEEPEEEIRGHESTF